MTKEHRKVRRFHPCCPIFTWTTLDKELERRGHRFCRYADDCNVYVRSKSAAARVMASLEKFLNVKLKLRVNRSKSVVGRPWKRTFLGHTMTKTKSRLV